VTQRETQTAKYWQQFSVTNTDIENLFKQMVDSQSPHGIQELAVSLIEAHCQAEEVAMRAEIKDGIIYQPHGSYQVGDELVFPRLGYASGKVINQRPGHNPQHGDFTVIAVDFGTAEGEREFAADFSLPHPLNVGDGQSLGDAEGVAPAADLFNLYGDLIVPKLEKALAANEDFLSFGGQWLLKGAAIPIHAGHLNIAEAAIDIQDAALPAAVLLNDFDDLPANSSPALRTFSLNATLSADPRFVNLGPKGETRWYLERLLPPHVGQLPEPLRLPDFTYDSKFFDDETRQLLKEIDDEATPVDFQAPADPNAKSVTLVLNRPHRWQGTLPVTRKNAHFFPEADEDIVRITFIDKGSGDKFAGWVVSKYNFVSGLADWYKRHELPVGA
jgi:hypothetical protein